MEQDKRKNKKAGISEKDFKQLIKLLSKLEHASEVLFYLMENARKGPFTIALISAKDIKLKKHIKRKKRDTDILTKIDKNLYSIICQDTEVDGGYYFMQRLVKTIKEKGGDKIYCSVIEIGNTEHKMQEIVFRLLNMYRRTKAKKEDGKISYFSLK